MANEQVIVQVSISSLEHYFPLCHDILPFYFFLRFHLAIALPYLLTTHSLHSSTKKTPENSYEHLSPYLLRLLISPAHLLLHLTYLKLLQAHPFLVLSLPQRSHLGQSPFVLWKSQDLICKADQSLSATHWLAQLITEAHLLEVEDKDITFLAFLS